MLCPVCTTDWETRAPTRCVCGYDFQSGDIQVALVSLRRQQRLAKSRIVMGLGLVALSSMMLFAVTTAALLTLLVKIFGGLVLLTGGAFVYMGVPTLAGTSRRIRTARALTDLPRARMLNAPK